MRPSPEIETPHPSKLGGRKGKRGRVTNPKGQLAQDIKEALRGYRVLRYVAHSQARLVLTREALLVMAQRRADRETTSTYPGDIYRTIDCMSKRHTYFVKLNHNPEFNAASYSGLVTCGSVWACPICASKVQERRRIEIEQAIGFMATQSVQSIMPTFTFPHLAFHSLSELLAKQALAFKYLRGGKVWSQLMKSIGFRGLIRSLEVTHGANGWHPHTHELWFVDPDCNVSVLRAKLAQLWARSCKRAGLLASDCIEDEPAFFAHSVDVRGEVDSGDYLAKQDDSRTWGIAHEVAKATSKAGRAKGVHPHHFLIRCGPGDDQRYVEYVNGMKGKRQLFWSKGLKATCGVGEITDEELAEKPEAGSFVLALIPARAWNFIIGNDARCELLDAAEVGGFGAVCNLLRSLGVPESFMPLLPGEEVE